MAYNDFGPIPSVKKDTTVTIGVPKWLREVGKTVKSWFKDDDFYSLFFKVVGVAVLAPIIGVVTLLMYTIPMPAILCTLLLVIALLIAIGVMAMDSDTSAKEMFWVWVGVTTGWYVASLVGILEIYAVRAIL